MVWLCVPFCHLQDARQVNCVASGAPLSASRAGAGTANANRFEPARLDIHQSDEIRRRQHVGIVGDVGAFDRDLAGFGQQPAHFVLVLVHALLVAGTVGMLTFWKKRSGGDESPDDTPS